MRREKRQKWANRKMDREIDRGDLLWNSSLSKKRNIMNGRNKTLTGKVGRCNEFLRSSRAVLPLVVIESFPGEEEKIVQRWWRNRWRRSRSGR